MPDNSKLLWSDQWRREIWALMACHVKENKTWDLIIIGGGITGAGVVREAAKRGLNILLIEQKDFAWGASSNSSKMIHGGLRYLMDGDVQLVKDAVREREKLLKEAKGLVKPLGFFYTHYQWTFPGRQLFKLLLWLCSRLAKSYKCRFYKNHEYQLFSPGVREANVIGATRFIDAVTDDARLVFRILREAVIDGATIINYVSAQAILQDKDRIVGVKIYNQINKEVLQLKAHTIINATGAALHQFKNVLPNYTEKQIRPLRGGHLILPIWRLPVAQGIIFLHPVDKKRIFICPWEGVILLGATDLDHKGDLINEVKIIKEEVDYLLQAVNHQFPAAQITSDDIRATYAGIGPAIRGGKISSSKEKRRHYVVDYNGLISVSGGKLTTFRVAALDVLQKAADYIPGFIAKDHNSPTLLGVVPAHLFFHQLTNEQQQRLVGRYGQDVDHMLNHALDKDFEKINETVYFWFELRWSAYAEAVVQLDDLLLRRTRLGLLLPKGGEACMGRVAEICRDELGWDDQQWRLELKKYQALWASCYSLPMTAKKEYLNNNRK